MHSTSFSQGREFSDSEVFNADKTPGGNLKVVGTHQRCKSRAWEEFAP